MTAPVIYWFRQDLRLGDLRGLHAAVATGRPVLACYILDDDSPGEWRPGGASRWWLHHSLAALQRDVQDVGGQLHLARGHPVEVLARLAAASGADRIYCSRQYEPWARRLEEDLFTALGERGVALKRFGGGLLWEPESVKNLSGEPFRVFTPFWRKCRGLDVAPESAAAPRLHRWPRRCGASERLADWALLPTRPNWAAGFDAHWQPGERGAHRRLSAFLAGAVARYDQGRNVPAGDATSRLSAHLHFGEIAPARVFAAVRAWARAHPALSRASVATTAHALTPHARHAEQHETHFASFEISLAILSGSRSRRQVQDHNPQTQPHKDIHHALKAVDKPRARRPVNPDPG